MNRKLNIVIWVFVAFLFASTLIGWWLVQSVSNIAKTYNPKVETVEELYMYLANKDYRILASAILSARHFKDPQVPATMYQLWTSPQTSSVDVDVNAARHPVVKLALCQTLLRFEYGEREEYEKYIYSKINAEELEVRRHAAYALGSIATNKAVKMAVEAIKSKPETAMEGAKALYHIAINIGHRNDEASDFAYKEIGRLLEGRESIDISTRWYLKAQYKTVTEFRARMQKSEQINTNDTSGPKNRRREMLEEAKKAHYARKYTEALKLFRIAAEQGEMEAAAFVGFFYFTGSGVEKNYVKAAYWLRKAADAGYPQSQFRYALLLLAGKGVDKNEKEGRRWLGIAAENGFVPAKQMLLQLEGKEKSRRT